MPMYFYFIFGLRCGSAMGQCVNPTLDVQCHLLYSTRTVLAPVGQQSVSETAARWLWTQQL